MLVKLSQHISDVFFQVSVKLSQHISEVFFQVSVKLLQHIFDVFCLGVSQIITTYFLCLLLLEILKIEDNDMQNEHQGVFVNNI